MNAIESIRSGYFERTPDAIARRKYVIEKIGYEFLDAFEMWAFKTQTPMIYDRRIRFMWQNAHSTKEEMPEDATEAIDEIIKIWNDRFS